MMANNEQPRMYWTGTWQRPWNMMDYDFGTWNTQTLSQIGKLNTLLSEMNRYNIKILAVQETRWTESDIFDFGDFSIFRSSGREKQFGVAFIVHKDLRQAVIDFTPRNERMCIIRLKMGSKKNLTLINIHAPTNEKDDTIKDLFYDELDMVYDSAPNNDIKIVLGDFNAKIGREEYHRETTGPHSLHATSNNNGFRAIEFAHGKDLQIRSTYLPRKDIHKMTWKSPDGRTFNQIDHVLIQNRSAHFIHDIKTRRGANCDSDHFLVKIKYRSSLRPKPHRNRPKPTKKYDVIKLSSNLYRNKYEETLKTLNSGIEENAASVNENWINLRKTIEEAATKVIGFKTNKKSSGWFDEECQRISELKQKAYLTHIQNPTQQTEVEYRNLRNLTKATCRRKRRIFANNQISDIDSNFNRNNSREAYKILNSFKKGSITKTQYMMDVNGQLTADPENVKHIWKSHFETVLNSTTPSPCCVNLEDVDPTQNANITLEEVKDSLKRMKNGKASGVDGIPGELIKNSEYIAQRLHNIVCKIWIEENIPEDWKKAIIQPIHKKGNKMDCKNYRGISLLCTAYKVFSNILRTRILAELEDVVGEYQGGFRGGRSTIDQLFVVRQTMEKFYEYNVDLHQIFVDFKMAYDSINRNRLYAIMLDFGIPKKLVRLTKMTMTNTLSCVRTHFGTTDEFPTYEGLKQGDGLAPILFNIALEYAIRRLGINQTHSLFEGNNQILAYADDVNIMSRDQNTAFDILRKLQESAKDVGLQINTEKTKYMEMKRTAPHSNTSVDGIGAVDQFVYLGSTINSNGNEEDEIDKRILATNRIYFSLQNILKSKDISKENKIKIYKTLIRPVLTYGSETWTIRKATGERLKRVERKILRRVFGPVFENGEWRILHNEEVYQLYQDDDVLRFVELNKLRWAGHVARMDEGRFPKKAMEAQLTGKRPVGRPRKRYEATIKEAANRLLGVHNWKEAAINRNQWKDMITQAKGRTGP